jgi:GTP-binding protein HflX
VATGDRLFHTLDPLTRAFEDERSRFLITDTVGFIEKLPHQLVDAFRATLEETVLSDALLLVVDGSGGEDRIEHELAASEAVLKEIGADDKPRVTALNKIDLLAPEAREELALMKPDAIQVSAESGEGLDRLAGALRTVLERGMEPVELLIPYAEGSRLSEVHEIASSLSRTEEAEGVRVTARLPVTEVHRFEDLAV